MENEIDVLKRIKQLENEGSKDINYATENAARIVHEAELKAKQNEDKAAKEVEEDYEAAVSRAKEKAEKQKQSILGEASAKINELKSIDKKELLLVLEQIFSEDD